MQTSSQILDRIMVLKNIKTDAKLSELFGVASSTVNSWRSRNAVPYHQIFKFCEDEGFSLNYVFYGEGPKYRNERVTDADCVVFLVTKAMRDTGIILTPDGFEKMLNFIMEEAWSDMKLIVADTLKAMTKAAPSWKPKDKTKDDKNGEKDS